jgi:NADH dehydrogenase (ubiquinone) Fe-S protein 7
MINSGGAVPVKDNVEYAISRVDDLVNWARKGSLWPSKYRSTVQVSKDHEAYSSRLTMHVITTRLCFAQ